MLTSFLTTGYLGWLSWHLYSVQRRSLLFPLIVIALVAVSWIPLLRRLRMWHSKIAETNKVLTLQKTKLERLTRASQTSVDSLIHNSGDAIVIIDDAGKTRSVNAAAEKLFGRKASEIVGKDFGYSVPAEEIMEIQIMRAGGKPSFGEMKMNYLEWKGRSCRLAIIRDITERKLLQAQLFQSQKMDAVGKLAGGIAHDFNNLLTVINGFSLVAIQQTQEGHPAREALTEILSSGQRAEALTRQLLAFSRRQIISPRAADLNVLIRNSEKMLRRLIGEDIELSVIEAKELGVVNVDPSQVEQVIMNMAVNARDAMMPKGGKLLLQTSNTHLDQAYVRQHSYTVSGDYVMLAVSDTGCGIAPEVRAHIFEPFFTTKEQGKGTGLGLATCYGIVKQNGGHIEVYSEVGRGTVFKIYFPRSDKSLEASVTENALPEPGGNETILVVEDEPSVRSFAKLVLQGKGYTVVVAEDGQAALELVARNPDTDIHLVLTDVVMPRVSGHELFEKLKAIKPGMKALFSSGYTEEVIIRHEVRDRQANFLQKPFTVAALLLKVREVLDAKSSIAG